MKKEHYANPNPTLETRIMIGNEVLDAEEYQSIRCQHVKQSQSPIMDLDAIQRARFAIKPRVIEDVVIA